MSVRQTVSYRESGNSQHFGALAFFLALSAAAAFLGSLATTPNIPNWYATLNKPSFTPPNAVFPIAWTLLYVLMAAAAWLVWRTGPSAERTRAIAAFMVQLALNVGWSWAFFAARSPIFGLAVIVPLFLSILWTTLLFQRLSGWAAALMLPYLGWVAFASALNFAVFRLN